MSKKKNKPLFHKPGWVLELEDGRKARTIAGSGYHQNKCPVWIIIEKGKYGEKLFVDMSTVKFLHIINLNMKKLLS